MRSWPSLVLVLALAGCGGAEERQSTALEELPGRPCPEASALTWESFGAPFLSNYCVGCHSSQLPTDGRQGAPVGVEFDTRDGYWKDSLSLVSMATS